MKTRIFALAVALAIPASAALATTVDPYHAVIANYDFSGDPTFTNNAPFSRLIADIHFAYGVGVPDMFGPGEAALITAFDSTNSLLHPLFVNNFVLAPACCVSASAQDWGTNGQFTLSDPVGSIVIQALGDSSFDVISVSVFFRFAQNGGQTSSQDITLSMTSFPVTPIPIPPGVFPVPVPIPAAGLPFGLILASGGLLGWWRRRQNTGSG